MITRITKVIRKIVEYFSSISESVFIKCPVCKENRFIVKKRTYKTDKLPNVEFTSQVKQCKQCYRNIMKMVS